MVMPPVDVKLRPSIIFRVTKSHTGLELCVHGHQGQSLEMHGPCRLSSMISESFLLVPVQDRHQAAPARIVPRSASEEKLRAKARECQHRRRRFAQIVPFARCFLRTPAEMRPDRRHRVLSAPPLLRDRTVRAPDWRPQSCELTVPTML
jgi:hypothetical protein